MPRPKWRPPHPDLVVAGLPAPHAHLSRSSLGHGASLLQHRPRPRLCSQTWGSSAVQVPHNPAYTVPPPVTCLCRLQPELRFPLFHQQPKPLQSPLAEEALPELGGPQGSTWSRAAVGPLTRRGGRSHEGHGLSQQITYMSLLPMARHGPVLDTFTTCALPCAGKNDTTCFLILLVAPSRVTELKNQQFPGDFAFLMNFCSEGTVHQWLMYVEGRGPGCCFIHVL